MKINLKFKFKFKYKKYAISQQFTCFACRTSLVILKVGYKYFVYLLNIDYYKWIYFGIRIIYLFNYELIRLC